MQKHLEEFQVIDAVRCLRKLLSNCDSQRYTIEQLVTDSDLALYIPDQFMEKMSEVSNDLSLALSNLEKSQRYKQAVLVLQYRTGVDDEVEDLELEY